MEIEVITNLISSVGFPIFVAIFMMTKGSKDSAELRKAVDELTIAVKMMGGKDRD